MQNIQWHPKTEISYVSPLSLLLGTSGDAMYDTNSCGGDEQCLCEFSKVGLRPK